MPLVKAQCTNCNGFLEVDNSKEAAICPHCGTPYIVEKAIQQINNTNYFQNATIVYERQISGRPRRSLDFQYMKKKIEKLNLPIGLWFWKIKSDEDTLIESEIKYINDKKQEIYRNAKVFIDKYKTLDDLISCLKSTGSFYRSESVKVADYFVDDYYWKDPVPNSSLSFYGDAFGNLSPDRGPRIYPEAFIPEFGVFVDKRGFPLLSIVKADETSLEIVYTEEHSVYETYKYVTMKLATQSTKTGCYIATCVYGSYDCPQVWTLRRYRDTVLSNRWFGRLFIKIYYTFSPLIVKIWGKNRLFKAFWRCILDKKIASLNKAGIEAKPYKDRG